MLEVLLGPEALRQIKGLRRVDAVRLLDSIDRHLRREPDRPRRSRIKRLRGRQDATCRLRVGDDRAFYDVGEGVVTVIAVLHKRETAVFYRKG